MCVYICNTRVCIHPIEPLDIEVNFKIPLPHHTHKTNEQYKHPEAAEAAVLTRNGYQCYGKKIKASVN